MNYYCELLAIYLLAGTIVGFENLTGIIIAFITGVVGPILVLYIKSKLEGKKEKQIIK